MSYRLKCASEELDVHANAIEFGCEWY